MKWLCEKIIVWRGWTIEGTRPDVKKAVFIGAPHTSNWDFLFFMAVINHFDMRVKFLIKDGVMKWPLSLLLTRLGAIPVDRSSHHDLIARAVKSFEAHDEMMLLIAPEGTRARADHWRSGFWRIADAADVPVVTAFIDGETKRTGLGPMFTVGGDPDALMARAREFYSDKHGLKPLNAGPVRL
ncbi:MAG: 1-acyl-sn-glycerol-3-phosphate acyltransferase [Actinomycetota bacterium]